MSASVSGATYIDRACRCLAGIAIDERRANQRRAARVYRKGHAKTHNDANHAAQPEHQKRTQKKKNIDIALQGGGAHGALSWGILDRLLEDERLPIVGISGTSAGAVNAAVLADGFARGGGPGASHSRNHAPGIAIQAHHSDSHPPEGERDEPTAI